MRLGDLLLPAGRVQHRLLHPSSSSFRQSSTTHGLISSPEQALHNEHYALPRTLTTHKSVSRNLPLLLLPSSPPRLTTSSCANAKCR
jgi:hypothetical protein